MKKLGLKFGIRHYGVNKLFNLFCVGIRSRDLMCNHMCAYIIMKYEWLCNCLVIKLG